MVLGYLFGISMGEFLLQTECIHFAKLSVFGTILTKQIECFLTNEIVKGHKITFLKVLVKISKRETSFAKKLKLWQNHFVCNGIQQQTITIIRIACNF